MSRPICCCYTRVRSFLELIWSNNNGDFRFPKPTSYTVKSRAKQLAASMMLNVVQLASLASSIEVG